MILFVFEIAWFIEFGHRTSIQQWSQWIWIHTVKGGSKQFGCRIKFTGIKDRRLVWGVASKESWPDRTDVGSAHNARMISLKFSTFSFCSFRSNTTPPPPSPRDDFENRPLNSRLRASRDETQAGVKNQYGDVWSKWKMLNQSKLKVLECIENARIYKWKCYFC